MVGFKEEILRIRDEKDGLKERARQEKREEAVAMVTEANEKLSEVIPYLKEIGARPWIEGPKVKEVTENSGYNSVELVSGKLKIKWLGNGYRITGYYVTYPTIDALLTGVCKLAEKYHSVDRLIGLS